MTNIPAEWLGAPGPVQNTKLTATMSPGLREAIQAAAAEEGVNTSYWLRRAAIDYLLEPRPAEVTSR